MKSFRKLNLSDKQNNRRLFYLLSVFVLVGIVSLFLWQPSAEMQINDNKELPQSELPANINGANPQPAILGATSASNRAVVFPDPFSAPTTQNLVPGLPAGAQPHGVAYFGSDNALISDAGGSRVFVIQISTATLVSTINTAPAGYNGFGTIAVAPNLTAALAMGGSNCQAPVCYPSWKARVFVKNGLVL